MVATYRVIGKAAPRPDGIDKVTGRARYAGDYLLPGMLWGKTLHSPYPHARILSIDVSKARELPGVHAVITGADIEAELYGRAIKDIPVLATDRVRFIGERIAAVAADDEDIAQQAVDLIDVEYEELPAVFEIADALADGAPLLHPDFPSYRGGKELPGPSNAYFTAAIERGDLEAGFAAADVIVENTYETQRQHQAYLEPQTVLMSVEGDKVNVWACSKAPYDTRNALGVAIQVEPDDIIFNHTFIGGDFGGKATPANLPICYFLAKAAGRPVLMILDYLEEFLAGNPRHATSIRLRTGVKHDGTITAHEVEALLNCGAYAGYKPLGIIGGIHAAAAGPYRMEHCRLSTRQVYTNTVPGGHMRSPGEPQAAFAVESHLDEVARRLGLDPVDFRLRNLVVDGDVMPNGAVHHDLRGRETLEAAVEAAGYYEPKRPNVGRGVAIADRAPGGGVGNLQVTLKQDGTVLLGTPVFDQGTGTYATLRAIVAEELEVPLERIDFELWATGHVNYDSGIGGMRATRVNTEVAYQAAQDTKQALLRLAAERMEWPEEALVLRGDEVHLAGTEDSVRWPNLLQQAGQDVAGSAFVEDRTRAEKTCFVAQVAEVEVDPETGEVKLVGFTTAHDVAQIVNPVMHQGQINGGLVQGIGYAFMEELRLEDGRVSTLSFGDYKIPTSRDIPPLTTVLLPSESGLGHYAIKGIGETPNTPTAGAIANAIEDAIGVRIRDLPITSEKVYRARKGTGKA